ncbi:hypothetical protein Tco_0886050 [Tanacetum coccineum]
MIQYPRFTKHIIVDFMKKFPSISLRLEEEYHSIKDDIPLGKKRNQSVEEASSPSESLKVTIKQKQVVEGGQDDESYASKFVASMLHDDVDNAGNRIEPGSHKEHLEVIHDDDDDIEEEKKDEKKDDERVSEVPALISKEFDAQEPKIIEDLLKKYVQNNVLQVHPITTTSTDTTSSAGLQQQPYSKMKRSLQDQVNDPALWEEWDAWVEETIIDEDEVIPEDETLELITEFQNVDKRVLTIFDRARMEATLNDMLSNQFRNAEEYGYHLEQATNFMENQIVWESR